MDDPGYRARRRAAKQAEYYSHPAHGQHEGVETVAPLNEAFVPTEHAGSLPLPSLPDREKVSIPEISAGGYEVPSYRPPVWVAPEDMPGPTNSNAEAQSTTSHAGPPKQSIAPVDESIGKEDTDGLGIPGEGGKQTRPGMERHHSVRDVMKPHLQFMAGPMLVYHTVKDNVWHGAAMIVTSDAGSVYDPSPSLSCTWDAGSTAPTSDSIESITSQLEGLSFEQAKTGGGGEMSARSEGERIFVYHGPQGTFTFTRFQIRIPLTSPSTSKITYRVNSGTPLTFFVPGTSENLRWAAHSCNGFSGGVKTEEFFNKEKGFTSGYDPLWEDMLDKHEERPFHCMVGGGDQIYCDSLMFEPELQEWANASTAHAKLTASLTPDVMFAIDRYYFSHYCKIFRSGAFGLANASIPMLNMLDDHDLIDGFGSYPDDLQQAPVFKHIGSRGYFWYLLFQLFIVDEVDGTDYDKPHPVAGMILGGDGPFIPNPGHSYLSYLGPDVYMLLLDCRAERKKDQVCSKTTYDRIFAAIKKLPALKHLVVQLGIPIAYPRMNFLEKILEADANPAIALAKKALPGFANKFNDQAELLDDLSDHWTASDHKSERNWLVEQFQRVSLENHVRISFVSGDVHCAAVAAFYTCPKKERLPVEQDPKYMVQIVTSAIVNTPPPPLVGSMVSRLGEKRHKTLHYVDTDEEMLHHFSEDTDGTHLKHDTIMGRRNWTMTDYLPETGELRFDIRVEIKQGDGETKGYPISAPPPSWTRVAA